MNIQNNNFSLARLFMLIKREWAMYGKEMIKKAGVAIGLLAAIYVFVFIVFNITISGSKVDSDIDFLSYVTMGCALIIVSLSASSICGSYSDKDERLDNLMSVATTAEKYLTKVFFNIIILFALLVVSILILDFIRIGFTEFITHNSQAQLALPQANAWSFDYNNFDYNNYDTTTFSNLFSNIDNIIFGVIEYLFCISIFTYAGTVSRRYAFVVGLAMFFCINILLYVSGYIVTACYYDELMSNSYDTNSPIVYLTEVLTRVIDFAFCITLQIISYRKFKMLDLK